MGLASDVVAFRGLCLLATGFKAEKLNPLSLVIELTNRPDWLQSAKRERCGELWRVRIGKGPYCYGRSLDQAANAAIVLDQ